MSELKLTAANGAVSIVCTGYSIGLTSTISSQALRKSLIHLPVKVSQSNLTVSVTLRSRDSLTILQKYIRDYHLRLLAGAKPMHITYAAAIIDYYGIPISIVGGAKKFDFFPSISLEFILVQDLVNNTTTAFSRSDDPSNIYQDFPQIGNTTSSDDLLSPPATAPNPSNRDGTRGD